jgi:ABC-2 type transport system permease protein
VNASTTYIRYELLRMLRNRRFFLFSLGFPLVLYYVIAAPNRNVTDLGGSGVSAPLYLMVGLAAFGTMNAVISGGARIALDRSVGWTRQLRLTPLSPRSYLATKILVAYLTALITIVVLAIAGRRSGCGCRPGTGSRRSACCSSACCRSRRSGSCSAIC